MTTSRRQTEDGFELMLGTNALGHAALAGLLLSRLAGTPGSRVVAQSSEVHRHARLALDDCSPPAASRPWRPTTPPSSPCTCSPSSWTARTEVHTVVANPGWVVSELGREVAATGSRAQRLALRIGNR
jgi:hypothetical protein